MARKLSLADNSTVNVMGVGVVKIKLSNGVVHTLDKVAYVPKLRQNLISLSQLDSEGYGYKNHGEVLKVTKGLMVLMKGELRRGLYRLDAYAVKTSKDSWKRKSRARVSFAEEATKPYITVQRSMISKTFATRIIRPTTRITSPTVKPCHVFINHRGIDTKRTIAGLLYQHLLGLGLNPFLDIKSMRPGDRLFDKIDPAIKKSRVGVAIFSQHYCESYFCLHELAIMTESKKKIVPIFCDVKPSELKIKNDGTFSNKDFKRFQRALDESKHTVGLTFDTSLEDWSVFLTSATNAILQSLLEVQETQPYLDDDDDNNHRITKYSGADSTSILK
ncbi:putative disease resistance protein At4g19530 [Silene latifolia]|uniref:putative disease resistance protein At4g19530 n=1 Tax=Silene latifolia TaxID=37657 RepID=UPI003D774A37